MIYDILQTTGLPCAYSHFNTPKNPPYLVYLGDGQNTLPADDTYYWTRNVYSVEYYFTEKDEAFEEELEELFLENGFKYTKSEDSFVEEENVYVIYYNLN